MNKYYLKVYLVFGSMLLVLLCLHYFGWSPYGGPVEKNPLDFFPAAVFSHLFFLTVIVVGFGSIDMAMKNANSIVKLLFTVLVAFYLMLDITNMQMVRWLGSSMSLGYFKTFFGSGAGKYTSGEGSHFVWRIITEDLFMISSSFFSLCSVPFIGLFLWIRRKKSKIADYRLILKIAGPVVAVSFIVMQLSTPVAKVRARPLLVGFANEIFVELVSPKYPKNPGRAFADLSSYANGEGLAKSSMTVIPEYPLVKVGPGELGVDEFKALPKSERPNIIFLEMESLRGWESALPGDNSYITNVPEMDEFLKENAVAFPWTHSNGFPSAVGTLCIDLGIPPHSSKFIATEMTSLRASSLPEIFRDFGYKAEIMVGTDPAISNFTHWFDRWFEKTLLDPEINDDASLFEEMDVVVKNLADMNDPFYLTLYTISLHIPFTVPEEEGIVAADSMEGRFKQAINYSTKYMVKFLEKLKESELWSNTIVVIVGDHSYPTPDQVRNQKIIGPIHPGLTWISMAITGGWHGLPSPKIYEKTVSQLDLSVTLLKMLNMKAKNSFMGADLFDSPERPVFAVAERQIMLQLSDVRYFFALDNNRVYKVPSNRKSTWEYGQLGDYVYKPEILDDVEAERWRDLIRAYSWLMEKNRVFPDKPKYLK